VLAAEVTGQYLEMFAVVACKQGDSERTTCCTSPRFRIAQTVSATDLMVRVRVSAGTSFPLPYSVLTGCGAHSASYLMGNGIDFPRIKAGGT
jgi:hypothetical protein